VGQNIIQRRRAMVGERERERERERESASKHIIMLQRLRCFSLAEF
jgi:hypothetical protein